MITPTGAHEGVDPNYNGNNADGSITLIGSEVAGLILTGVDQRAAEGALSAGAVCLPVVMRLHEVGVLGDSEHARSYLQRVVAANVTISAEPPAHGHPYANTDFSGTLRELSSRGTRCPYAALAIQAANSEVV